MLRSYGQTFRLSFSLFVCIIVYWSVCLLPYLTFASLLRTVFPSFSLFICMSNCLFVELSVALFDLCSAPIDSLSVFQSLYLYVQLSVCRFVCLSLTLFDLCFAPADSLSVSIFVYLSVCLLSYLTFASVPWTVCPFLAGRYSVGAGRVSAARLVSRIHCPAQGTFQIIIIIL